MACAVVVEHGGAGSGVAAPIVVGVVLSAVIGSLLWHPPAPPTLLPANPTGSEYAQIFGDAGQFAGLGGDVLAILVSGPGQEPSEITERARAFVGALREARRSG